MVKRERTEYNIVTLWRIPFEQVRATEMDLRICRTQSSSNIDGRFPLIDRVDPNLKILSTCVVCNQPGDIARAVGDAQDSRVLASLTPASQTMSYEPFATAP